MADDYPPPPTPRYRSVHDRLQENARLRGDRPACVAIDQGSRITWAEMARACNQIAHFLAARGLKANDRVVVLTENSLENLILYYGVQNYGASYCTINVEINAAHLREMLERLKPTLVLWHDELDRAAIGVGSPGEWVSFGAWRPDGGEGLFAETARLPATPVPPVNGEEDICTVCFTSGTTATPKGVMHSYGNLDVIGQQTVYLWGLTEGDRVLEYRSLSWSSSHQVVLHPTLISGDTLLLARRFSQSKFFEWIKEWKPTVVVGVPTVVNMLLARPVGVKSDELASLRFMSCSTAPLLGDQHRKFEDTYGIKLIQHYGMSEGGTVAGNHWAARRIGTVGRPGLLQNLKIVDESGAELPAGTEGEIEIGGPQQAYGYLMEDGSIERVRGKRLKTGDLGVLDPDGFLRVTGRAKDLVIRGGVNIAPLEIDNVLMQHPDVFEAASVGVPDKIYGEELAAYVVPKPGKDLNLESVRAHCAAALPEFKLPKEIILTDAVPKNDRGKVDRNKLRDVWRRSHPEA
ncbi:MAG: class I adenylate-forming enzyme family protein [Rhodospirillales bacterium]